MDKNDELHQMVLFDIPNSVNILINTDLSLFEARNLGIQNAGGDVIAFIDAVADDQYLEKLIRNYKDEKVIGVVGMILPRGFTNYSEKPCLSGRLHIQGFSEERCKVRNVHVCNMSFKKKVFEWAGFFDVGLGWVRQKLVIALKTEFNIRSLGAFLGK